MELFSYDVNGEPKITGFLWAVALRHYRRGYTLRLCQHANFNCRRSDLDLYYKWHPDSALSAFFLNKKTELCFILQIMLWFFFTSPSCVQFLLTASSLPSQSSQSAGWGRRVLQITVSRGVDPRGRVPDHHPLPPSLAGLPSVRVEPRARVSR